MDPHMSDQPFPDGFGNDLGLTAHRDLDDGIAVRFPPGLGLIPPRELARVPRPRRGGELVE
jgi:hypothetical protein